jgi:hypothetical protein
MPRNHIGSSCKHAEVACLELRIGKGGNRETVQLSTMR